MVQFAKKLLSDYFTIESTNSLNKSALNTKGTCSYPYVTRTSVNNGIESYTNFIDTEHLNPANSFSLGLLQMTLNYQNHDWYAGQFVRRIIPKKKMSLETRLYLQTCMQKIVNTFDPQAIRKVNDRFNQATVQVPVTASGALDTEYMASYVRKIEASYVRKIEAYLSVLGYKSMDDVKLTDHEQKLLDGGVKAQPTSKFRISTFYQVCPISFKYDGSQLRKAGSTPVYSSIETKYGVLGYTDDNPQFDITVNDYLIFGDHTRTMRFPNKSFSVADNTKVLRSNFNMTQKQKLFLITAWSRAIPNLGYARHWSIAKKAKFILPIVTTGLASGDPDWQFMEDYMTAIEKLKVLKLKQFLDHKLDLYQKVIN